MKDKFNPSDIKKHMQLQHPLKWKKYIIVWDARISNPEESPPFFEQSKMCAFWYKSFDNNRKLLYSIEKRIVEAIIEDKLFDEKDIYGNIENGGGGDGLLPGDLAMKASISVKNEAGEVESYMLTINNKAQFEHVLELDAASLSFRQVSKIL